MNWTPRMQQLSEEICRYALETGKLPTMAELGRRMGLSRTRTWQIWVRIERYERSKHLDRSVHEKRASAGYLHAVLKDIEKAARMAGRAYPWKRHWQGPKQPQPVKPPKNRAPIYTGYRRRWSEEPPIEPREPRWNYRPRFSGIIDCPSCHGNGVIDGEWCPRCGGEATIAARG